MEKTPVGPNRLQKANSLLCSSQQCPLFDSFVTVYPIDVDQGYPNFWERDTKASGVQRGRRTGRRPRASKAGGHLKSEIIKFNAVTR